MSARFTFVLAAALAALATFPVESTLAAPAPAVRADQVGWWSRSQLATGGLGLPVQVTLPPSPTTPAGSAPVAAVGGEPVSVVAIGFAAADGLEPTTGTVTVSVPLARDAQDVNGAAAGVVACRITEPWGAADNGPITEAPVADCEGAPKGVRQSDGSWRFDVPPLDLDHGILLTAGGDQPTSFQIPFTKDASAVGVAVTGGTPAVEVSPPPPMPEPVPTPVSPPAFDAPEPVFSPPTTVVAPVPVAVAPARSSGRHIPSLPAATLVLALAVLAAYVAAGLSVGRRLHTREVLP